MMTFAHTACSRWSNTSTAQLPPPALVLSGRRLNSGRGGRGYETSIKYPVMHMHKLLQLKKHSV